MDKHNTLYTAQNKYTQADPKSLKYIKNNCISMSISLSVSARDTDIGGRAEGSRTNIDLHELDLMNDIFNHKDRDKKASVWTKFKIFSIYIFIFIS